jgi:type I restriction enzyme S subunit
MVKDKLKIPKGWTTRKIKDLLSFERPDNYIVKSTVYTATDKTPVLTANKSFILGYTDEDFGIYKNLPAIIFDDFTTDSKFVDFPFKIKSSAIKILTSKDDSSDLKYVYEVMKSINFPIANHKRHYISQYQEQDIVVPLLPEQKKIAEVLSTVDSEIEKVDKIIIQTEKLKSGLMTQLFTKGIDHKKFKKTKIGIVPDSWEIVRFEKIFATSVKNGLSRPTKVRGQGIKMINMGELFKYPKISNQNMERVPFSEKESDFLLIAGDILFARQSLVREGAGKSAIFMGADEPTTYEGHIIRVRLNKMIALPDFYFYFLNSNVGRKIIEGLVTQTAAAGIRGSELSKIFIPFPKKEEQERMVKVLLLIDEKLATSRILKQKLSRLKKGLMSDLLSGKVRVINK